MAVNYDAYRPEIGKISYVTRIDDLITELATDISDLQTLSDANALYINSISATGFSFNDNVNLTLGTGNDTNIYHDSANTYIDQVGTGDLKIKNGATEYTFKSTGLDLPDNVNIAMGSSGTADSYFYYDGIGNIFYLISSEISLVGNLAVSGTITGDLTGDVIGNVTGTASNAALLDSIDSASFLRSDVADIKTNGDLVFNDNVRLYFGTGSDMYIYHGGSNSFIVNNTGTLNINSPGGISATGVITSDAFSLGDNNAIYFGASTDAYIYHDATNTRIRNNTGNLYITHGTSSRLISYATGAVGLYHSGSLCAITGSGITFEIQNDLSLNGTIIKKVYHAACYCSSGTSTVHETNTSGWSVSRTSTGHYVLTHNLGTVNYNAVASVDNTTSLGTQHVFLNSKSTNTIGINIRGANDVYQDNQTVMIQIIRH